MELVTLWFFLALVAASLGATYICKKGRYIVVCVQCKQPANINIYNLHAISQELHSSR